MSASIASGDHTKIAGVAKSPGHGKIEDDPKTKTGAIQDGCEIVESKINAQKQT